MQHRYDLGMCMDCRNIVSVLVSIPDYDRPLIEQAAEADLQELEQRLQHGDRDARQLLPLHRRALEESVPPSSEVGRCTACGGRHIRLFSHVGGDEGEHFEDGTAWLDCPRCEEGRLWLWADGTWDEIDNLP
jgi:hypothetical protein